VGPVYRPRTQPSPGPAGLRPELLPDQIYYIGKFSGVLDEIEKNTNPSPHFLGPSNWGAFFGGKGRLEEKVDVMFGLPDSDLLYRESSGAPNEVGKITDPSPNFGALQLGGLFGGKGRLEKKVDVIFGLPDHDLLYREIFRRPR
jgi:hypothetical protein